MCEISQNANITSHALFLSDVDTGIVDRMKSERERYVVVSVPVPNLETSHVCSPVPPFKKERFL
jgi:hypothetical protein